MKVMVVTDAWSPQVNGVVTTLGKIRSGLEARGHETDFLTPAEFTSMPCPTYPEIRLSLFPYGRVARRIEHSQPRAIHIATEGPLGIAARRYCLRNRIAFTTAYHTRFPEYVHARTRLPVSVTYRWLRHFHGPSRAVMVPTPAIRDDLARRGFDNTVLWTRGVDTKTFCPGDRTKLKTDRPVFLYVGRVAVEKNIEAFLKLDLPGSKWVVGEGPQRAKIEKAYPEVHFAGIKTPAELAAYYRAADVFVFPSLTDTFGLVILEALACGTPVAAFPVAGPIDVIGSAPVGVLDNDLRGACLAALHISRDAARRYAEGFAWEKSVEQFESYLAPSPDRLVLA
ncbi:MAG: glycosyltransferase family 4 protein [Burkholderiales bacterium]